MYAQLGSVVFEKLKGFESFADMKETNLPEHAIINGKPRLQFVGEKLQEIQMAIHMHAAFCVPEDQYNTLDYSRSIAEVLTLVWGNGSVEGDFVIVSIGRKFAQIDPQGNQVDLTLDLVLRENVDPNKALTKMLKAKAAGFATNANRPLPVAINPFPPSPGMRSAANVTAGEQCARKLDKAMTDMNNKVFQTTGGMISQANSYVNLGLSFQRIGNNQVVKLNALLNQLAGFLAANPTLMILAPFLHPHIAVVQVHNNSYANNLAQMALLPPVISTTLDARAALSLLNQSVLTNGLLLQALVDMKKFSQPLALAIATRRI